MKWGGIMIMTVCLLAGGMMADGPISFVRAEPLSDLYAQMAALDIGRHGYTLGEPLTDAQKQVASKTPLAPAADHTIRFQDGPITVVADDRTYHVLVVLERHEDAAPETVKAMLSDLFLFFDAPTVSAHDRVVYWAFDDGGKVHEHRYQTARQAGRPIEILATVKLDSDLPLSSLSDPASPLGSGELYCVISSPLILSRFFARWPCHGDGQPCRQ